MGQAVPYGLGRGARVDPARLPSARTGPGGAVRAGRRFRRRAEGDAVGAGRRQRGAPGRPG